MNDRIVPINMPVWGMTMEVGTLSVWHVNEGDKIEVGQDLMDVETDKIANVVEASDAGLLRRRIGEEGTVYPVKAMLGVMAPAEVSDEEIDAYIAAYDGPSLDDIAVEDAEPAYEFIETPSGRLRYAVRPGEGRAVILVHGFGGDIDNWLFNIDAISGPVYAFDFPGHGQSVKAMIDPGVESMSNTLGQFIDAMGLKEVTLVGHSMGGLVSANFALRGGGIVKSLTLISPAGLGEDISGAYIDGFVSAKSRRDLKPVLQMLFVDPNLLTRALIDDVLKYRRLDGVQETLEALSAAIFPKGKQSSVLADQLSQLDIPIQVIWGAEDQIVPAAHAHAIEGATVEIIKDIGHVVQMEAAAKVNELINAQIK